MNCNRAVGLALAGVLLSALLGSTTRAQKDDAPSDEQLAKKLGVSVEQVHEIQSKRGYTNAMLAEMSPAQLPALVRKMAGGDLAERREDHAVLFLRDRTGLIPNGAALRAIEDLRTARENLKPGLRVAGLPSGPRVERLLPRTAGLKKDQTGWDAVGPHQVGGRTRALLIHPNNPDIMYAASAGGGVWKTSNGGESWSPLNDFLANMAVSCMVMHPANPKIIYVGTGEGFNNGDAVRGGGIFMTEDGGASWAAVPIPFEQHPTFQHINRLALSPDGVLLAAVGQGDRDKLADDVGIYRSADPKRTDWSLVLNGHISCVHFDPSDSSNAIAGALELSPNAGEAYFSVDGGKNWERAKPSEFWRGRVELTHARAKPSIVYASTRRVNSEVWRSEDGGQTYKKQGSKTNFLVRGWYNNVIWAGDPDNADLVIVGAVELWRSVDGGKTLEPISNSAAERPTVHADQHAIVAHPDFKKNKTIFVGNDGGIYRATDIYSSDLHLGHKGYSPLNDSYAVTQFYGIAGHAKSGMILGGTQDNGTHLFRDGKWSKIKGGDGGFCAIDKDDPSFYYGEYFDLQIYRSKTDAEKDEDFLLTGYRGRKVRSVWQTDWLPAPYHIPDCKNHQPDAPKLNFIAPFILDPNDSNRLLAGAASLWLTTDARSPVTIDKGPKWTELKKADKVPNNFISAIAVAGGESNIIWVGHNNGAIYTTKNGKAETPTWTQVTHKNFPMNPCTRITIDAGDHSRVYATFGGYDARHVWKTEDGGAHWQDISAGLPNAPCRSIAIHPRNPSFLYLATDVGVFASEDGGKKWSSTNEGPTNCRVDDLIWMDQILVAASHGRGIFRIDLSGAVK